MFTGLIEEVGTLHSIEQGAKEYQLKIKASTVLSDVHIGDSIAVNGVCLTVTAFDRTWFQADVMPETLKATALNTLKVGSKVNLERAMTANRRFGGHFVSGHVDGTGRIIHIQPVRNAVYFRIALDERLLKYLIPKGSVAVDGISLTVVDVTEKDFSVSIIPHTLASTNLHAKQVGDLVNIECDMLAKYIERMFQLRFGEGGHHASRRGSITLDTLKENGFL